MKFLRQTLGLMQPLQQAPAKELLDEPRVEVRQWHELTVGRKRTVGHEHMQVRVEVRRVGAERLDRDHETRLHVTPVEDRADARDDRVATRAGDEPQQAPLPLEHASQDPRDRQHAMMSMENSLTAGWRA